MLKLQASLSGGFSIKSFLVLLSSPGAHWDIYYLRSDIPPPTLHSLSFSLPSGVDSRDLMQSNNYSSPGLYPCYIVATFLFNLKF